MCIYYYICITSTLPLVLLTAVMPTPSSPEPRPHMCIPPHQYTLLSPALLSPIHKYPRCATVPTWDLTRTRGDSPGDLTHGDSPGLGMHSISEL